ncbi:hypothetical protein FOA52_013207 [Chlamydomonas sp. UWO 241]|nr:hypothetical protein FOA52_013207 [Chlamydomonas sp. UWO 241]
MQAAGRLRLLGRGQTLHLAASSEVTAKIQSCVTGVGEQLEHALGRQLAIDSEEEGQAGAGEEEEPSTRDVLQWVMHNTVQATLHGIAEWSRQGLVFAATKGRPERVPQDERMELGDMYGASSRMQPIAALVQAQARSALQGATAAGGQGPEGSATSAAAGTLASRMHAFVECVVAASQVDYLRPVRSRFEGCVRGRPVLGVGNQSHAAGRRR